jgi:tight adherence protein B
VKRLALVAVLALAAAALFVAAGAAGDPSGPKVVEAQGPAFPTRTYVLSLPHGRVLTIHDVHVTENGAPVAEPTLTPASKASKKTFGVVLLLDTSWSMHGKPLAAALAAEQAFVAQRKGNEQVGAIDFNRKTTMVLPLTTSPAKISAALAKQPRLSTGTHIYDGVARAERMLNDAHISSGSIVLLSDGADTGSARTLDQVAKAAVAKNTRIYTIGLADSSYKPATLKALADTGQGEYRQANAQGLTPLFDQLGQQISNEYLLQYKSLLGPAVPAHVGVTVNGVGASGAAYKTPALPVAQTAPTGPYHASIGSRIWSSPITMILIALLAAAVIAILTIGVLQPRRSGLPARMAEFVSIRDLQKDKGVPSATAAAAADATGPGAPKAQSAWERFKETLEIAEIQVAPEMIILGTVLGTVLVFFLILAITGSPWWGLFALGVPYFVREWILRTLKKRRERFAEQLPDALQVIASALRSGHSFAGALAVVVEGGSEPMKSELQQVVADEQRGVPIQNSLDVVAQRMASADLEQLALVAELQREAGGNAAEVIDRVAETVRERFDLKRLIKTLTMQGRMSLWIVSALPVFIILVLRFENPGYLHPLLATTGGRIVFGFAAAWAVAGSLVIKRIVDIEV